MVEGKISISQEKVTTIMREHNEMYALLDSYPSDPEKIKEWVKKKDSFIKKIRK